jgi:hypothetical protein
MAIYTQMDAVNDALQHELELVTRLREALIAKAFRGQLRG